MLHCLLMTLVLFPPPGKTVQDSGWHLLHPRYWKTAKRCRDAHLNDLQRMNKSNHPQLTSSSITCIEFEVKKTCSQLQTIPSLKIRGCGAVHTLSGIKKKKENPAE